MSIFIPFILCFSKLYHYNRQYSIVNVQKLAQRNRTSLIPTPYLATYIAIRAFILSSTRRVDLNHMHKSAIVIANAAHRIRTCKPFTANGFQDRSLTTRTYGKYSSVVELLYPEISFATTLYNFMRTFYRLRQTFFQVYCRKLAQCVGFEPTRRINARRLSKPFQYHYGNTAEFSCIVKNIRKETADTFLAGVMPAGGFEPPFCYHAYSGI